MILQYLNERPTKMMVGRRQKVYEICFEVTNWTKRFPSDIDVAVRSYIKSTFKKNATSLDYAINAELYKEITHPITRRPMPKMRDGLWASGAMPKK